jgi:polysaccharide biosynthesis/export protein
MSQNRKMEYSTNRRAAVAAIVLLVMSGGMSAQDAGAAAVLGSSPAIAHQCNGPLGALLPECQAGKNPISITTGGSAGPVALPPAGQAAPVKPAPPEHDVAPAPAIAEPATEFQRFVASSVGKVLPVFGANLFEKVPTTFAPLDRVPVTSDYVVGPGDELLLRMWGQVNLDTALTVDRAGAVFVPQAGNINVAGLQYQQLPGFLRAQFERVFRNFDLNVNMGQLRSIQIFVVGHARRPGTYTVSSLSTLVNALFASGGPSPLGSMRRIQLKRGTQLVTEIDLYDLLLRGDKSKDARLLPGDVVYIPPAGAQMAVAGSVRSPGIYETNGEKTVADLVQLAGGLSVVADSQRARLERIRDRSARESIAVALDSAGMATPVSDGDVLHIQAITPRFDNTVTLRGNVANPGRFPWHPGMRLREVIPDKESLVTRDYWNKRNVLGFMSDDELAAAEPQAEAQRKPAHTSIEGGVPEINWSYAVIERQNPEDLTSELVAFHPGKLILERDETANLELRKGDVITIFSQADIKVAMAQQRRLVRLEGEFASAGVYAAKPGETLGQLIQRAGGLTPHAYLFGAEFLRESTRADQQRRLDQLVQEMEQDVEHIASNRMNQAPTAEETALLATRLESERALIARLRAVKATGRIVLNFDPGMGDVAKLMELALEDGDRFIVPAKPATVNVLGAVYNQNSFVYEPGRRIADYLGYAGGATRNADNGRMFIIRADGSVVPRHGSSPFSRSFESNHLNPGDSVVVPDLMFKTGVMKGIRDWAQIVAQFALGAAAINVLR